MSGRRFTHGRRPLLFVLLTMALGISIVYGRVMRFVYLPSELRYLPEYPLVFVATGSIEQLWKAVDGHFGRFVRDQESEGALSSGLREMASDWEDSGTPVGSLEELAARGIDVDRGAVAGFYSFGDEAEFVAVLPLWVAASETEPDGYDALIDTLEKTSDEEAESADCETETTRALEPVLLGGVYLVRPEPGLVIMANSCDLLDRSLLKPGRNLRSFRDDDGLYLAVRARFRRPLLAGAGLFVYSRAGQLASAGITEAAAAITLDRDRILVDAKAAIAEGEARLVDDLLRLPAAELSWRQWTPSEVLLTAVFQDTALNRYPDILAAFGDFSQVMEESLGGVGAELTRVDALRQVLLVSTGLRRGLPQAVLGIWGAGGSLADLVDGTRRRLKIERDRRVLEAALERYAETAPEPTSMESAEEEAELPVSTSSDPGVADLIASGILRAEEDALFERYPIQGLSVGEPELTSEDLQTDSYRTYHRGLDIGFLMPKTTRNDLDLLFEPAELEDLDQEALLGDRYRLASLLTEEVLWIASDLQDLKDFIDARQDGVDAERTEAPAAFASAFAGSEKLRAGVDVATTIEQGLLSGEEDVEEWVRTNLSDLRDHPRLALEVEVNPEGRDVRLALELRRFRPARWQ